jgi:ribonuclease Z
VRDPAHAGRLVLVHLPPGFGEEEMARAREIFPRTDVGEDGATYEF